MPKWTVGSGGSGRRDPAVPDRAALPGPARWHSAHRVLPRDADARGDGVPAAQQRLQARTCHLDHREAERGERLQHQHLHERGTCRSPTHHQVGQRGRLRLLSSRPTRPNVFNRTTNPNGIRCDLFQTNVNLLGKPPGTQEARRPIDNVGVQYGLAALNSGRHLGARVPRPERAGRTATTATATRRPRAPQADADALEAHLCGRLQEQFQVVRAWRTFRSSRSETMPTAVGDIHDTMQDLDYPPPPPPPPPPPGPPAARERPQRQPDHLDAGIERSNLYAMMRQLDRPASMPWLDNMAADTATASIDKVVRNKPVGANDACWDASGTRIDEVASTGPGRQLQRGLPALQHAAPRCRLRRW